MTDRPVIGDFRSKPDNKPREETTTVPETAPSPTDTTIPPTPVERYQQSLKDVNLTPEEARGIYDAVLTKGYYEETVTLRKGTTAVFRTRQYDDTLRIQMEFEAIQPRLAMTQEDIITRFNLAASLCEWQGKTFTHENDEDFDKALAAVKRLPGPVYSLLAAALSKFDRKVMVVFGPGATENFS